ncbi:hypothetical protein DdX_06404 [Ditylenchus destructor]|uniref:Uncharacterized protein n=1 Tax=Ditylenchus destructor TaxID=166010 RepID=A0AAD4R8W6_9BILA|nr:hypothetical protein DdX_06404 [Ditylenchus destructor]
MKGRCAAVSVAAGLELWDQFLLQKHKTDGVGHSDWGGAYHMWLTDWLGLDHFVLRNPQTPSSDITIRNIETERKPVPSKGPLRRAAALHSLSFPGEMAATFKKCS